MSPPDPAFDAVIGVNLRHLREGADLTRSQLAVRVRMDAARLAEVEDGRAHPTARELVALHRGLGCELSALFAEPRAERAPS